jgi:hypothetical protein
VTTFITLNELNWGLLLDGLALAASLGLFVLLLINRRRYGRLLIPRPGKDHAFQREITLQMINQQSRQAFLRLQQALDQELESLQGLGDAGDARDRAFPPESSDPLPEQGRQCLSRDWRTSQTQASRMLAQGCPTHEVAACCQLPLSAVDLIRYIQRKSKPA